MDTHARRVEPLQILYEILSRYSQDLFHLVMLATFYHHGTKQKNPTASDYVRTGEQLIGFWVFFMENRSFLSGDISEKVHSVYLRTKFLHEIVYDNLPNAKVNENSIYLQSFKHELFDYHKLMNEFSEEEWEELSYAEVFKILLNDIDGLVDEMRELYEAAAGSENYKR